MTPPIIAAVIITVFVFGVGGMTTKVGPWYRNLRKPVWNPPNWIFGPAWAIILGLTACSGVLAWINASDQGVHLRIAVLFGTNIFLHTLWSPLFFYLQRPYWALIEGGLSMAFDRGADGWLGTGLVECKLAAAAVSALGNFRGYSQFCHSSNELTVRKRSSLTRDNAIWSRI